MGEERKAEKQMLNSKTFRRSHVMEQEPRKTIHKVESERCPQDVILLEKSKKKEFEKTVIQKAVSWCSVKNFAISHSVHCPHLHT